MRLKALHSAGMLDISAQETLTDEMLTFRRTLAPGAIIEVPDQYRGLKNIDSAIRAGLLSVLGYDTSDGSLVVYAELAGIGGGTWHEDDFVSTDGQTDFVLSSVPTSPSSIILFYGGLVQPGNSYSVVGGNIVRLGFGGAAGIAIIIRYT